MSAKQIRCSSWLPTLGVALIVGCGKAPEPAPTPPPPATDEKGKIQGPPTAFQPPAKSSKKGR